MLKLLYLVYYFVRSFFHCLFIFCAGIEYQTNTLNFQRYIYMHAKMMCIALNGTHNLTQPNTQTIIRRSFVLYASNRLFICCCSERGRRNIR